MHPAANPVQKGRNLLNASAQINEGTATIGCINIQNKILRGWGQRQNEKLKGPYQIIDGLCNSVQRQSSPLRLDDTTNQWKALQQMVLA